MSQEKRAAPLKTRLDSRDLHRLALPPLDGALAPTIPPSLESIGAIHDPVRDRRLHKSGPALERGRGGGQDEGVLRDLVEDEVERGGKSEESVGDAHISEGACIDLKFEV